MLLIKGYKDSFCESSERMVEAARDGNLSLVVAFLLLPQVEVKYSNFLALRKAAENGHLDVVKSLVEFGADIHAVNDEALRSSACRGHLDVVKYLVGKGADVDLYGQAALSNAARFNRLEVTQYLISLGIPVPQDLLSSCADIGYLDIVRFLVMSGADVSYNDFEAYRYAKEAGHFEVAAYLAPRR